jgi:hypothetical protein
MGNLRIESTNDTPIEDKEKKKKTILPVGKFKTYAQLLNEKLIKTFEIAKLEKEIREVDRKLIQKRKRETKEFKIGLKQFRKKHPCKVAITDYDDYK